mgnify:FL=1
MAKSVIGGFQKIPKKNKYREDEWVSEKSKKNKTKRTRSANEEDVDKSLDSFYEEDYEQKENYN